MTTTAPASATPDPTTPDPCAACDPDAIGNLACAAVRFQRQAEVTAASQADRATFTTAFGTARADITKARQDAQTHWTTAQGQLDAVKKHLECALGGDVRGRLDAALEKVLTDIAKCADATGCCVGTYSFDLTTKRGETLAELTARIEDYQRQTDQAVTCFKQLVDERTALPQRAATLEADATQLAADVTAATTADAPASRPADEQEKLARLYVRLLVSQRRLTDDQSRFATVDPYMDCLCAALTCALKGWEATATLAGIKAEWECREKASTDACLKKKDGIEDAVWSAYVTPGTPSSGAGQSPHPATAG